MRKFSVLPVLVSFMMLLSSVSFAQKKELSYEQIFKAAATNILKPLPVIKWLDDEHYLITQKDKTTGTTTTMSVDAKTGQSSNYSEPGLKDVSWGASGKNEKNLTISPDEKWVAFTRDKNLFAREIATGKEIQLSNDASETVYNGYAAWLYYEEILGRASHYKAFWWSPDSRHIAYMHFDESEVPVFPIYNSEGLHGSLEKEHYPKVGDKNPAVKIGIADITTGQTKWADFNEKDDQYFGALLWTPTGSSLWVQWMPRNQHELKIYAVDPALGSKKEIYSDNQKTWVDLDHDNRILFLPTINSVVIQSDKTGWMHLYLYKMDGTPVNAITEGDFTVTGIEKIDERNKLVYFTARKENSARTDFYKTGLNGKGLTRLSFGEYTHDINLSPGGSYFITSYSNISTPTRMALVDNKGKIIREIADSKGAEFDNYALPKTELVRVKSHDGLFDLPMTIIYPVHFDASKKYPVLISIYGGPNAGTVYDRWNSRFLNNQWWAQEGLIQVSMDNRSSGHFGKKGMNYIYHQLGIYETEDYMDCGKWLRSQAYVDSSKICIAGGSFGGYMTCMALTYGADVFTHGIATSSVTDWSLYDSHYTERYMGTQEDNAEGYKNTSPQTYVKKYRGLIRIVHGNLDDNVHMQNSIQLINKLEDLDKHFEFMIYPGERHGWGGLKAIHSRNESNEFIYDHLLNKPIPAFMWK